MKKHRQTKVIVGLQEEKKLPYQKPENENNGMVTVEDVRKKGEI